MEFYLMGGAGWLLGFLMRLVASRWEKPGSPKRRASRWFAVPVIIAVTLGVFSPLVFPLVADILVGLGMPLEEALGSGWHGCLVFYALLGMGMGWMLGDYRMPRAKFANPYADNSAHPFGVSETLTQEEQDFGDLR